MKIKYGESWQNYAKDLKKWNPQIHDWSRPEVNQLIYIDYPYSPYLLNATWAPPLGKYEEDSEAEKNISLGLFYSMSFGAYSETINDQFVKSSQNFPVTLGIGTSVTNELRQNYFLGSIYWARPTNGNVNGGEDSGTSSIQIPGELGGNAYYMNYFKDYGLGFYGGYDYEKLNTFNTSEVISGAPVENVRNDLHYGTLGVNTDFIVFDQKMGMKTSFSKVFKSSSAGYSKLSGNKFIVYYTYRAISNVSLNIFYKHHTLNSSSANLSIDRIGVGVGYSLF